MVFNAPTCVEKVQPESLEKAEILSVHYGAKKVTHIHNSDILKDDSEIAWKFVVKETSNRGQGMFAAEDILPGTVILRYITHDLLANILIFRSSFYFLKPNFP